MLNWKKHKGTPQINIGQVWEWRKDFKDWWLMPIDLGSFAVPILSENSGWIITESTRDSSGVLYKAGHWTHNNKWNQDYLWLRLDVWETQGNTWSLPFTLYKHQFHRGQGLNVRG